jgi:2-polyprenyl-3-methyl-5-hydroxy-6-metoxy-1,4-benzoquinol methylase
MQVVDYFDLGCGHVPFYEIYRPLVTDIVCIDWCNSYHKNELLDYACDLTHSLPLESQSFDTVLLTDVLEHLYEPLRVLAEVRRVLRPGGHVIVGVPLTQNPKTKPSRS